jgi:hypothetical protein
MTQTIKQIDLSLEQFDAIIESLDNFHEEQKSVIVSVKDGADGKIIDEFDLSKLEDLRRLYINYCHCEDSFASVYAFLLYFISNERLLQVITEYVHNDMLQILNKNNKLCN